MIKRLADIDENLGSSTLEPRRWHTELLCNEALDQRLDMTFATQHVERRWQATQTLHAHPEIDGSPDIRRWGLNE